MRCDPWRDYCSSLEFFCSLSGATQIKGFASFTVPDCRVALTLEALCFSEDVWWDDDNGTFHKQVLMLHFRHSYLPILKNNLLG